jgi:hypothetical protein
MSAAPDHHGNTITLACEALQAGFSLPSRMVVFLYCLLDGATRGIPHTEPSDLAAIFPAQHYRCRDAH